MLLSQITQHSSCIQGQNSWRYFFSECNISTTLDDEDNDNRIPHMDMHRAMEAMIEERTLFEGKVTRDDILDYLVLMQNDRHRCQYRLWAIKPNCWRIWDFKIGHLVSTCIDEAMMTKARVICVILVVICTSKS